MGFDQPTHKDPFSAEKKIKITNSTCFLRIRSPWDIFSKCVIRYTDMAFMPSPSCDYVTCLNFTYGAKTLKLHFLVCVIQLHRQKFTLYKSRSSDETWYFCTQNCITHPRRTLAWYVVPVANVPAIFKKYKRICNTQDTNLLIWRFVHIPTVKNGQCESDF